MTTASHTSAPTRLASAPILLQRQRSCPAKIVDRGVEQTHAALGAERLARSARRQGVPSTPRPPSPPAADKAGPPPATSCPPGASLRRLVGLTCLGGLVGVMAGQLLALGAGATGAMALALASVALGAALLSFHLGHGGGVERLTQEVGDSLRAAATARGLSLLATQLEALLVTLWARAHSPLAALAWVGLAVVVGSLGWTLG